MRLPCLGPGACPDPAHRSLPCLFDGIVSEDEETEPMAVGEPDEECNPEFRFEQCKRA